MSMTLLPFLGGQGWCGVWAAAEPQLAKQLQSLGQGQLNPVPSELEIAAAPEPMRVDPAPLALLHHLRSLRDQVERGQRQHQAETRQGLGAIQLRRFQLETVGLVVQEVLLDPEASAVFVEGVPVGGLVADDIPATSLWTGQGQVDRAEALRGDEDVMPQLCLPAGQRDRLDLAATHSWSTDPEAALDPDAPVPAQLPKLGHQLPVGEAAG